MAEGTPRLARAQETAGDELLRDELQRRLDRARDSISQTVSEVKDTAVHRFQSVKENVSEKLETLDWREQFRERPVAWSVGAIGAGFILGYLLAGMLDTGNDDDDREDDRQVHDRQVTERVDAATAKKNHRGVFERFKETQAYHRMQTEASTLGNRFADDLAQTAKDVLLPAAIRLIRGWLVQVVATQEKQSAIRSHPEKSRPID